MPADGFYEGVRPGGLTSSAEIRILLCYLLDCAASPVSREQIEQALLGEELVNYFALNDSLAQIQRLGLAAQGEDGYSVTEEGKEVGRTLARKVPLTVREAAVRSVIRARQYAAKKARHLCEIIRDENAHLVTSCSIADAEGALFKMELYMPDTLCAEAVRETFVQKGDAVYKLVLAALTRDTAMCKAALRELEESTR